MGKTIHGNLKVTNDMKVKDDLKVSDNARIKGRLSVDEETTLESTLSVAGNSHLVGTLGYKVPVAAITGNVTLTTAQSGTLFTIGVLGAIATITLPAVTTVGTNYRFLVTVPAIGFAVTITAGSATILGSLTDSGANTSIASDPITTASTTIVIATDVLAGSSVQLISTGTNWFATGLNNGSAASNLTAA